MALQTQLDRSHDDPSGLLALSIGHSLLRDLVAKYGLSSEEFFFQGHRHPFLIQILGPDDPPGLEMDDTALLDRPVYYVRKGNAASGSRVMVGRTMANDIVIPDPRVSQAHAYFQEQQGAWSLTDMSSSNGSYIAEARIEPRIAHPLPSSVEIKFSRRLSYYYLDAAAMLRMLIKIYNEAHG